jgi:hypothetical protein
MKGETEIFSTDTYVALTVMQMPGRKFWIRIDTGAKNLDFIGSGPSCSV